MDNRELFNSPKVTVIISTYNRQKSVARAINCVLHQTFKDFELIIVNDRSTDDTEQVVKAFNDPRIKYIFHEVNRGGSAARNTGIALAKGEYIAFLDDDDEWLPSKLEKQVEMMNRASPQIGLIYVGSQVYDEKKKKIQRINYPRYRGDVYRPLLISTILGSVSSVLVKKECFDRVGVFDESLSSCQDWDMWLRIAKKFEFDFVPDILTTINWHGEQISSNFAAMIPGRIGMVEKHRQEFQEHPEIFVIHLKRIGKLHTLNGTCKEGRRWFKEALKVNPFEIFKISAWCLLELPMLKLSSRERNFKKM